MYVFNSNTRSGAKERPTSVSKPLSNSKAPYMDQRAAHTVEVLDISLSLHTCCIVCRTARTIDVLTV